jgi:hypothetical protein
MSPTASLFGGVTKIFEGLGEIVESIAKLALPPTPPAPPKKPADMTDRELRVALIAEAGDLLNDLGPITQASFGTSGAIDDLRWHHAISTTVDMHTRGLFLLAGDSYGIACVGQKMWASATSLGPIRHLAESLAQARWLLEGERATRRARALALTSEAIDSTAQFNEHLKKSDSYDLTVRVAKYMDGAVDKLREDLSAIRAEDGIPVVHLPSREDLFDKYAAEVGYLQFALLSTVGSHPGAQQSAIFYGDPGRGRVNYDFQGEAMEIERAYWVTMALRLFVEMCRLCAPVIGMVGWEPIVDRASARANELEPEVVRRWVERRRLSWEEIDAPTA